MRLAGQVVLVAIAAATGAIAGRLAAPDPAPGAGAATVPAVTRRPTDQARIMVVPLRPSEIEETSPATLAPQAPTAPAAPARRMPDVLDERITSAAPDPVFAASTERTIREALGAAGRLEGVRCGGDLCRFAVIHGDEDGAETFQGGLGPRFLGAQLHVVRAETEGGGSRMTVYVVRPRS